MAVNFTINYPFYPDLSQKKMKMLQKKCVVFLAYRNFFLLHLF